MSPPGLNITALDAFPALALGETTMAALAVLFGKGGTRAVRAWWVRHGVPYRRDGKNNWVRVADVRGVLEGLPLRKPTGGESRAAAVAGAVPALTGRR